MTTELQRAMARYEGARIQYQKAVLASLHGEAQGTAIRDAIRAFQDAAAELRQVRGTPPRPARAAARRAERASSPAVAFGFGFVRRLLNAG